ncbi:hypothetical protein C4K03_4124 [Pseudomonas synxantha]|uniref:Uncharacterized protein n=1 Tax=Pseudomonas synxantha TaxID=47883 RepID=A0A3G7UCC5_9PSED|nr:hypothetical protein [Pseudomonas synxantha]AZE56272.1 hypothetical protein C4K03_4124 [Pseudomonas synxantha]
MSAQARLIFLALVAASGETLYVKVPGNYQPEHCSAFVQARVVPQLMPELGASASGGRAVPDQLCATLGHLYRRARLGLRRIYQIVAAGRRWPANVIAGPQVLLPPAVRATHNTMPWRMPVRCLSTGSSHTS